MKNLPHSSKYKLALNIDYEGGERFFAKIFIPHNGWGQQGRKF